jgi:hypothetical protein
MNPIKRDLVFLRCCIVMICLFLSSCTKQQHLQQAAASSVVPDEQQDHYRDMIVQQEAMLVDIPIPFYDERINFFEPVADNSDTLVFGYKSPLSRQQAIDFFMSHMERLGWKHMVSFEGEESLLQFESPDRFCTVVIKKSDVQSGSLIFIYIKRASTEARS